MEKKTKIIATISDRRCDPEFLMKLIKEGANAFRLNTAHQTLADTLKVVKIIRKISEKIPIIVDTKGPEIRTAMDQEEIILRKGQEISVGYDLNRTNSVSVSYEHIVKEVPVGKVILVDDGELSLKVVSKSGKELQCIAENSGKIKAKKSVNIPEVHIKLPSLTKKDKEYIDFCAEHKIDFIAHSFIRGKGDLDEVAKVLAKHNFKPEIISKIENQEGVDNIEEIIDNCYGIMIARGDLGIEIAMEKIPLIQRNMIELCMRKRTPVIVATQMLHTMMQNPRPTRSEVADIANAVLLGADCLMLSGETAYGDFPVEAVHTMSKIIRETEKQKPAFDERAMAFVNGTIPEFLAKSAVRATGSLEVKAIVTDTVTGRTPRSIASFRSNLPVYTQCYNKEVMRKLALSYGIEPSFMKKRNKVGEFVRETLPFLLNSTHLKKEDLVVILAGNFGPTNGACFIEISKIGNLMKSN